MLFRSFKWKSIFPMTLFETPMLSSATGMFSVIKELLGKTPLDGSQAARPATTVHPARFRLKGLGVTPCPSKPSIARGKLSSGVCAFREVVGVLIRLGAPTL